MYSSRCNHAANAPRSAAVQQRAIRRETRECADARQPRGYARPVTGKKSYDWQTAGGADDLMRLVDCLERNDVRWCAISGVAVNHWFVERKKPPRKAR